jgi:hypothetical protein
VDCARNVCEFILFRQNRCYPFAMWEVFAAQFPYQDGKNKNTKQSNRTNSKNTNKYKQMQTNININTNIKPTNVGNGISKTSIWIMWKSSTTSFENYERMLGYDPRKRPTMSDDVKNKNRVWNFV